MHGDSVVVEVAVVAGYVFGIIVYGLYTSTERSATTSCMHLELSAKYCVFDTTRNIDLLISEYVLCRSSPLARRPRRSCTTST